MRKGTVPDGRSAARPDGRSNYLVAVLKRGVTFAEVAVELEVHPITVRGWAKDAKLRRVVQLALERVWPRGK